MIIWKSKGLSKEGIHPPTTVGNSLAPKLKMIHNSKMIIELQGSCSKQD